MKLRLASIALILVGVGAVVLTVVGPVFGGSSSSAYTTSTVTTGTVSATSVATGTISPSTVYGLSFGVSPVIAELGRHHVRRRRFHRQRQLLIGDP